LPAVAAEAAVTTEVPAGQSKSIRLRGVAAGTVVAVRIVTSGRLLVALVGMKQFKEPKPDSKPLFRGAVQEKLSFRVSVPEADDYLLVLNNRAGKETLSVEVEIRTARIRPRPAPKDYSPRPEKARLSPAYFFAGAPPADDAAPSSTFSVPKRLSYSFTTLPSSMLRRLAANGLMMMRSVS
jgi:hypothetical protein